MHIIVGIKSVVTRAPRGEIVRTEGNCALNPFDRPALEVARQLKVQHGATVTVISMGPPATDAILREALATGADRAVLLCDAALAGADTLATSTALQAGIAYLAPFDLLLFGTRTSDSDTGQVGSQTAVLLDVPMVTGVVKIDHNSRHNTVERFVDGFREVFEVSGPAAFTIRPEAASPRDPPLGGLAAAFDNMTVEVLTMHDLGLTAKQVGEAGSPTRVLSVKPVSKARACQWIEGTPGEQVAELVRCLSDTGLIV